MDSVVTFKFLINENGKPTGDIRRVTLQAPTTLQTLRVAAKDILGWDDVVFRFQDEDGDVVTIASQHELDTAVSLAKGGAVRLAVHRPSEVHTVAPVEPEMPAVKAAAEAEKPVVEPEIEVEAEPEVKLEAEPEVKVEAEAEKAPVDPAVEPAVEPVQAAAAPAALAAGNMLDLAPDATIPENVMLQFSAIAEFFQRMAQQMAEFAPRIPVIVNEGIRKMSDNMRTNFYPLDVSVTAARSAPPSDAPQDAGNVIVHRLPDCVVHPGIECAHCHKKPITGMRYKCVQCDCDLCQDCVFIPGVHSEGHRFLPVCAPAVGSHFINSAMEAGASVKARAAPMVQSVKVAVGEAVNQSRAKVAAAAAAAAPAAAPAPAAPAPAAADPVPKPGSAPAGPKPARKPLSPKEQDILRQLNEMGFVNQEVLVPLVRKHKDLAAVLERLLR